MKTKTNIQSGGLVNNHNQTMRVGTSVKAGVVGPEI